MEQRIADELGVSRQWLVTGEGSKEQKRIPAHKSSNLATQRSSWRYDAGARKEADPNAASSAEDERVREMRASIRLLIGDHTDLQIIARLHEMLDDKNFSMPYRLLLVQTLLDELHHRYKSPMLSEP